mgnify:CR=1 FL=1
MLKTIPIILLLFTLGGFVLGRFTSSADFLTYGIHYGVKGFVWSTLLGSVGAIFWGIVKAIYNNKLERTKNEIITLKELKEIYEEYLIEIREKQINMTNTVIKINEPVSLIKQTDIIKSHIDEEIKEAYKESLKNKPKRLVLRKRK